MTDYYERWLSKRGRRAMFGEVPKRVLFEPSNKERYEEHSITDLYVMARLQWHRFALSQVNAAVKTGKLKHISKCKCAHCGCVAHQYHHFNGYHPDHLLDVEPVCRYCHIDANKTRKRIK